MPSGRADKAVRFVRKLRLHEGRFAGQPFPLQDWQDRIIRKIYGPVDDLGRRQVRTVFGMVPRGSGKTSLAAALGLLHTFGPEKEGGGQVIAAAADREQARLLFNAASRMISQDAVLSRITQVTPSIKRILNERMRGLKCRRLQVDEVWSFVAKKQRHSDREGSGEDASARHSRLSRC